MITKVKGEAIKEGSIPLSALATEVNGEIDGKYGFYDYAGKIDSGNKVFKITPYRAQPLYVKRGSKNIRITANQTIDLEGGPAGKLVYDGSNQTLSLIDESGYWATTPFLIFYNYEKVPIPTPDWNAQEGEDGYIENRPFYGGNIIKQYGSAVNLTSNSYQLEQYNMWKVTNFVLLNDNTGESLYVDVDDIDLSKFTEQTYSISDGEYEVKVKVERYMSNATFSVDIIKNNNDCRYVLFLYKYAYIQKLDDKYLPDTVLKTTPQELSADDKNQALANLGIDPVVLKYLANPFVIKVETDCYVPEELVDLDSLFNSINLGKEVYTWKYLNPAIYIGYDDMEMRYFSPTYREAVDNELPTLEFNGKTVFIDKDFKVVYY